MATPSTAFKAANMVMVTHLSQALSLPSVYELLTIVGVDFTFGTKHAFGSRVKIPYFGAEGAIVSVRFKNKSRGIRNEGGQLRNVVAVDLQYSGKNIHLKVSENKLALMGALTEAMGNGAFQKLLEHLNMVQDHWLHIRNLPADVRHASIKWLCELLYGPPVPPMPVEPTTVVESVNVLAAFSTTYTLKKLTDPDVKAAFLNIPVTVDTRCVMYLVMFAHEFQYYHDFVNKIDVLLTLSLPIYQRVPILGAAKIANAVYNYKVGTRVSLITLCRELHVRGYCVSYHNWVKSKSLHVMVPIMGREDEMMEIDEELTPEEGDLSPASGLPLPDEGPDERASPTELLTPRSAEAVLKFPSKPDKTKHPAHRFMIYQSGSVRQSSPCIHTVAEQIKLRLVRDIRDIVVQCGPHAQVVGGQ